MAGVVADAAAARPDKPALIFGDRTITYSELDERVGRAAGTLARLDVAEGSRVALALGNVPEYVEALHGVWSLGAVAAPLNVTLTPDEMGYVLADAEAMVVIADRGSLPVVQSVHDRAPGLEHVLVTGHAPAPRGTRSYEEDLRDARVATPVEVSGDHLALLAYTGGTTAGPRGAMLTHGNLAANLDQLRDVPALGEVESDVVLMVHPLFHIYGLNVVLGITLRDGATGVLVERFDPVDTLELVEKHRITVLFGAPPMFSAWLRAAEGRDFDLSSVRIAVSGTAPLPAEVLDAFHDRFGIAIWEGYGLTETAPLVTTNALGKEPRPNSIGLVLPGVEVRLVDERGEDVEEGDPGEIVVRGPNVFSGYWRKDEETASAFLEGWFRTGDVAYRDDDGYLHIVGRKKDLIIVSGFNVFPREVEEAILAHPSVAECAVVGVADDRTGEAVKALVVLRSAASATEEDIIEHCRGRLARFKGPKEVEFVGELPHLVGGKVPRRALRGEGS